MPPRALSRILLVDDDPDIRSVAALALQAYGGFTVAACGSAAECLAAAVDFAPDLIILDVVMPGMNGLETFEALRAMPATAATPVVFMTAAVPPPLPEEPRPRPLGVIVKPFDLTALPEIVRRIWDVSCAPPTEAQRPAFQALARSYRAELPAKVDALAKAAAPLQAGKSDVETLTTVFQLAHSLTGSAAIYGFEEVSRAAKGVERLVSAALKGQATVARWAEVAPLLEALSRSARTTRPRRPGRSRTARER